MSKKISVLLHWNLDYAEFPRTEAQNIIKSSYIPMVDALDQENLGPVLMNITGHTIEYLQNHNPEVIDRLRMLNEQKKIEFVGTAYSHPILPLLPKSRRVSQLQSHRDQIKRFFKSEPQGIWPPELAVSPLVIDDILDVGYDWVVTDHEHLFLAKDYHNEYDPFTKRSQTITEVLIHAFWAKWYQIPFRYFKAYRVANQWIDRFRKPFIRIENLGKEVKIMQASVAWTNITIFSLQNTPPFFSKAKLKKLIKKSNLDVLPLYGSDIEFFGYRSHTGNAPTPSQFVEFLSSLQKDDILLTSPTDQNDLFTKDTRNITAGSWAPDKSLKIWTDSEDNRELTRRMDEIYTHLPDTVNKDMIKLMRIAENSDARGWSPINERKMEAYSAINTLEELLEL